MTLLIKTVIRLCRHILNCILLLTISYYSHAQQLTQTIRGTVTDKVSQSPMPGAVVVLLNTNPVKGAGTDVNGQFIITGVPVGRHGIKITFVGYKEVVLPGVIVNSGKEVVLNIQMEENVVEQDALVIKAQVLKNKPLNEMSQVSTRTFSVEETQKFAAAVNDPARMATSFAGVVAGNDGNNTISVRGNSPNGLLWRMEGVDIPNPNHYSNVGTSGGGISILSAQLLSNSDFMTGAFTAEYGNALGGVFDLKLRKGNNQKREHTFQAGVLGIDVASEGPIRKGYDGSYLINYRYSTLSLLGLMGVNVVGDATLNFQDLSFNISLPTSKYGTFGVFGFGGLSSQDTRAEKDSLLWKEESFRQYDSRFMANTGAFGINNVKLLGPKMFLKTTLLFSGTDNTFHEDKLDHSYAKVREYEQSFIQTKSALSSTLSRKIDARNSFRTGFILSRLSYNFHQKGLNDSTHLLQTYIQNEGSTFTTQVFGQWSHKVNNRFTANAGLHMLHLALNNTWSLEPRASVKYDISSTQNIAFGYGLHGQIQPLGTYFAKPDQTTADGVNKNLEMSRAHHYVLSHDINITSHTHIKTEIYYQQLFNIPVSPDPNSTFSVINEVEGFTTEALVNKGAGKNYGVELTLERFLHRNFYYLLSVSLYESKYKTLGNNWFDTRFNTNYATTLTAGKEWQLSEKRKGKVLGINTKLVYVGGLRRTPIDVNASVNKGEVVYVSSQPYTIQNPDYFRIDIKVSLKRNFARSTSTISLDLQNATNRENIGGQYFDRNTASTKYFYQTGLIPVLAYRIEF